MMLILQPLSSFSAIKSPGDPAYISASLQEHGVVRVIMRSAETGEFARSRAQIDMTRDEFLAFAREGIKALENIRSKT